MASVLDVSELKQLEVLKIFLLAIVFAVALFPVPVLPRRTILAFLSWENEKVSN